MEEHDTDKGPGFFAAIPGVLFSPRSFFDRLRERPRWLVPFLVAAVVMVGANLLMAPYLEDLQEDMFARSNRPELAEARARQGDRGLLGKVMSGVGTAAWILAGAAAWAGAFLLAGTVLGGESAFKKMLAVSSHCLMIDALAALVRTGLAAIKGSAMVTTSLAVLWPNQDVLSVGYALLGRVDVFIFWWVIAASAGVAAMSGLSARKALAAVILLRVLVAVVEVVLQTVVPRIALGIS
jgi:hypothetical protein